MHRIFLIKSFSRCLSAAVKESYNCQKPIFNEVNIQMIDRRIQKLLFAKCVSSYDISNEACLKLKNHGINALECRKEEKAQYIDLPPLLGSNIKQHFEAIASNLSSPYLELINQLSSLPDIPKTWKLVPGWSAYKNGSCSSVECPLEDVMIFDTEVLISESHAPIIAVAASSKAWYLWVSSRLLTSMRSPKSVTVNDLIPFYSKQHSLSSKKCLIGHFVSYDRARIMEEYLVEVNEL